MQNQANHPTRAMIVFNPTAGQAGSLEHDILIARDLWREHGWEVELRPTRGPGDGTRIAREAAALGYDIVVAAGGDGTVNEVINGLAGTRTALGALPVGTVNVWVRELGLPLLGSIPFLGRLFGSRGRYKLTPDIPTLIEQGIPDFDLMTWTGILLPRGVPQPIQSKLREAILKAITDPTYVERQAQGGSEIAPCSPEEMRQIMVTEIQLYRDMMKIAGIEPE